MSRKATEPTPDEIKDAAHGRWLEIFARLDGYEIDPDENKHFPCPKCGGTDRFRAIDAANGVLYCNQCFNEKNGDGLAARQWLSGKTFPEVMKQTAEYLGVKGSGSKTLAAKSEKPIRWFRELKDIAKWFIGNLTKDHGPGVKCVKSWNYGTFHVIRFDLPTPAGEKQKKEFRPVHQARHGLIDEWRAGYPEGPRPLYHLGQVKAAHAGLVTIHGGEKCADAAAAIGLVATTNAGGEQAIEHTDWMPLVRFMTVAIVVDNDEAGERFGKTLSAKLCKLCKDIRIIRLPGLPPKGDIVQWIEAGGTGEQFIALVEATAPVKAADVALKVGREDDDPRRLAIAYLKKLRDENKTLCCWRDEWWVWDKRYCKISIGEARACFATFIDEEFCRLAALEQEAENKKSKPAQICARKVNSNLVNNTILAMSGMPGVMISREIEPGTWLPTTERRNLISLQNGLLDVDALLAGRDDCLGENTPDWFSPVCLPYCFDPRAACPKWEKFLEYCLEMDPERIKFLQEWAGYLLLPDTGGQTFVILEGEGKNGKSVYMSGITALLGEYNVSTVPFELFGERFALIDTIGKLLNAAADCGDLDKTAEGHLKWFTGGNLMRFDRKGLSPVTCKPTARLMLACNNRPRINDRSQGVWRRMEVVPWLVEVPEDVRIHNMDTVAWWQASGELPGMLNWAIRGKVRLNAQKRWSRSDVMEAAKEDYKTECNPARAFLLSCCEPEDGAVIMRGELYQTYMKWCHNNGHNHPLASNQFGKEMKRAFKTSVIGREAAGEREWFYRNVRMKVEF